MSDNSQAWRCVVCGYVHRGPEPPGECPVCGSPAEHFEPYGEPEKSPAAEKPKQWRCLVCNYIHDGDAPPDECPVCGTPGKNFEPATVEDTGEKKDTGKEEEIVIVGAGIAGISAAEAVRQVSSRPRITILSKENHMPYYRLNLTRLLAGELAENQLPIHPGNWFEDNRVNLTTGSSVSTVDTGKKQVKLTDGTVFPYDKLILTAGAHPFIPPIPGASMENVTSLRNLGDARFILKEAQQANSIVIIGGGILGLETAGALAKQKKKTTLIENFKYLMPRQLNQTAAELLKKHVENLGITLKVNQSVQELAGDERVAGVKLKNGETVPADLVVITAGVRSNSYLARLAGMPVNYGIIVDDYMKTPILDVYAAGDIAEHRGICYGLWNAAQYQGTIAGMNAAGSPAEFGGIPRSNSIKVLGIDLLSIGKFEPQDGSDIVIEALCEDNYCRFLFRDTHLTGSILYGNTKISSAVKKAIEDRQDCSGLLKKQPNATEVWEYFAAL